jgi:alpha-N-arabinofuranosidase
MMAALTEDHKLLTIAVVNGTGSEQKFDLNVTGMHPSGRATLWQLTGSSLSAENHVGQKAQVTVKEIPLGSANGTFTVAADSVNIYAIPAQ